MYHVQTLSTGDFYLTKKNEHGVVVASTVVDGRITNSTLSRLDSSLKVYKRSAKQMLLDLFRGFIQA